MVNIFNSKCTRIWILCSVLTSFSMTYAVTVPSVEMGVNLGQVAFLIRIEKLVKKVKKLNEKSDTNKMLDLVIETKHEIENFFHVKVDLDKGLDNVQKEISKAGHPSIKNELNVIKQRIKKREKKYKAHAKYIANVMYLDNYMLNDSDELLFNYEMKKKHNKKEDDKKEVEVSATLTWGVTVTLVGFFLFCLPIPICKEYGSKLMYTGVTICGTHLVGKIDEKEKEEQEREERKK